MLGNVVFGLLCVAGISTIVWVLFSLGKGKSEKASEDAIVGATIASESIAGGRALAPLEESTITVAEHAHRETPKSSGNCGCSHEH